MPKFPLKDNQTQEQNNNDSEKGKDYFIDTTPLDFADMSSNTSDGDLRLVFGPDKQRELYIYQLNNLIANTTRPEFKSSPNSVKIGFVDVDNFIQTTGFEVSDFQLQLSAQPSSNPNDQSTLYTMVDTKVIVFQNEELLNNFNIHVVSIDEPLTENNIDNLYIIDQYNQPWTFKEVRATKLTNLTRLRDFKTREGNPIIVSLQKQLPADTKVTGIKIKAPQTVKWGNIKLWGEVNGIYGYPGLNVKDKLPFPLLSMPIETQPKLRILQQWFSKQILPWNLAKQFLNSEGKSCLDLIQIGDPTPQTRKLIIPKARLTKGYMSRYYPDVGDSYDTKLLPGDYDVGTISEFRPRPPVNPDTKEPVYDGVEIELQDAPEIHSLQQVLLDMLTYTYNYNRNFDGATYLDNGAPQNEIAKLKAKFDGQKPEVVISNIFDQWKLDNPNFIYDEKVQIFKQLIFLLSKVIYSNQSVNKGLNDDIKLLSPYYFDLISKPEKDQDGYYEFKDVVVVLNSMYFDFSDTVNIKMKNNNVAVNQLYKLDDNQFNWLSISNNLEANDIPSLVPADITLASGEYGKYYSRVMVSKAKLESLLNLYSSDNNLFDKLEWFNTIKDIIDNNYTEFILTAALLNFNHIDLTAIDAYGLYSFIIETSNGNVEIRDIELFSNQDETISLVGIEL